MTTHSVNLRIDIDSGNEAFQEGRAGKELARILDHLIPEIHNNGNKACELSRPIYDVNGNKVGFLTMIVTEVEDEDEAALG